MDGEPSSIAELNRLTIRILGVKEGNYTGDFPVTAGNAERETLEGEEPEADVPIAHRRAWGGNR